MFIYKEKYIKYKNKYIELKKQLQLGGANNEKINKRNLLISEKIDNYRNVDPSLKKNKDIIEYFFKKDSDSVISELKNICVSNDCSNFNNDFNFMNRLVKINGLALEIASDNLKNNINMISAAILSNQKSLQFIGENFKKSENLLNFVYKCRNELKNMNDDFIKSLIENNGLTLQYMSEQLRANKAIVKNAIKNNGLALKFASDTLKADRDFIENTIQTSPIIYIYISDALKNDSNFINIFLEANIFPLNKDALNDFNIKISNNDILMLKFIKKDYNWFKCIGKMLKNIIFYIKAIKINKDVLVLIDELKDSIIIQYFANSVNNPDLRDIKLVIDNLKNNKEIDDEQIIYFLNSDIDDKEKLYLMKLLCSYEPNYYNTFKSLFEKIKDDDLLLIYDGYIPSPLRNNLIGHGGRCYFNSTIQFLLCIKEIRNIILQQKRNNSNDNLVKSIKSIFKNFLSKICNDSTCMENIGRYEPLFEEFSELSPDKNNLITNDDIGKSKEESLDTCKYGGDPLHVIRFFFFKIPEIKNLFIEIVIDNLDQIKELESSSFEINYLLIILNKSIRDLIKKDKYIYDTIILSCEKNKYQIKSILEGYVHKISYVRTIGNNWFECDDTYITKLKNFDKKKQGYYLIFEKIELAD